MEAARLPASNIPIASSRLSGLEKGDLGGVSIPASELKEEHGRIADASGLGDDLLEASVKGVGKVGQKLRTGALIVSGNGRSALGMTRSRILFLTSQPGRGGSCTDICAWLCSPPFFSRVRVEVDPGKVAYTVDDANMLHSSLGGGRRAARLDIPHGMAVKMVASVNVVVVYSISAGKIWIMAAKYVEGQKTAENGSTPRGCGREKEYRDGESEIREKLLLIKCAVLECNRPVYSLHLSLQHLLLGECGGVWVWPLRPLIKPSKRQKDMEQPREVIRSSNVDTFPPVCPVINGSMNGKLMHTSSAHENSIIIHARNGVEGGSSVFENLPNRGHEEMSELPLSAEEKGGRVILIEPKNGLHESQITSGGKGADFHKVPTVLAGPVNGIFGSREFVKVVQKTAANMGNGYTEELDGGSGLLGLKQNGHTKWETEKTEQAVVKVRQYEEQNHDDSHCYSSDTAGNSGQYSNSVHPHHHGEPLRIAAVVELPRKLESIQKKNGLVLQNKRDLFFNHSLPVNHPTQTVSSTESSLEMPNTLDEKVSSPVKQAQVGLMGPSFVPISAGIHENEFISAGGMLAQVVDIQEFSSRRFAVLDSRGLLYLLSLHDVHDQRAVMTSRINYPRMIHVRFSVKIACMAVLFPSTLAAANSSRRLWVSDGRYSNYIVTLSDDDAKATPDTKIAVTETVFTSDRLYALAAVAAETILVVTQGSIIAYVVPGS